MSLNKETKPICLGSCENVMNKRRNPNFFLGGVLSIACDPL